MMADYTSVLENGAAVDAELIKVRDSNLNPAHKITRSATVVISAYDAPDEIKDQADYVCDELGWETEVQNLITGAAGGKILLIGGTFKKSTVTGLSIPSNTIFELQGTIQLVPNAGKSPYILNINNAENISIRGGTYDGNLQAHTTITGTGLNIALTNVTNSEIVGVKSINAGAVVGDMGYAIYLNGCSYVSVSGCLCENAGRASYTIYNNCVGCTLNNNISINPGRHNFNVHDVTKCKINDNISSGGTLGVTLFGNVSDCMFDGNIFYNIINNGLMTSVDAVISRIAFINNTVIGHGDGIQEASIWCKNSISDSIIEGNQIYDAYIGIGIYGNDLIVSNNVIRDSTRGIYFTGQRCEINDNKLCNISIEPIYGNGATQNRVTGNYIIDCGALNLKSCESTIITNNSFGRTTTGSSYMTLDATTIGTTVIKNNFFNTDLITTIIDDLATNTKISGNFGYTTENDGLATITAGQTTVEVSHGLVLTPTRVLLTPMTATGGKQYYVSAKTNSTFTITIDSEATADISFDWQATA